MSCKNCFLHQKSGQCQEFCDTRNEVIIKDKGNPKYWTFKNLKDKCVCLIRIDDCVISGSTPRCDYLFLVCDETEKSAFFIELKGKDLEKALKQILSTINNLKGSLTGFCLYARIAVTKANVTVGGLTRQYSDAKHIEKSLKSHNHKKCNKQNLVHGNSSTSEKI
jgi:hypothetical protein